MILRILAGLCLMLLAFLAFWMGMRLIMPLVDLFVLFPSASRQAWLACTPFITSFTLCLLGLWFMVSGFPLLCLMSHSGRRWYRKNLLKVVLWNLKVALASLVGYAFCLPFGVVGVPAIPTLFGGVAVSLALLSEWVRTALFTVLGYVFPPRLCSLLVRKPHIIADGEAALLKTRGFPRFYTVGFAKVNSLPRAFKDIEKLCDVLLGAFDANVPLGYTIRFGREFHVYFYTGVKSLFGDDGDEVLENLRVLHQTVAARLPDLDVEIVRDAKEVQELAHLPEGVKIHVRNNLLKLASNSGCAAFGAIKVEGLPAYKDERFSSLIETLLNQRVNASYTVFAEPINEGFIASTLAKHTYRGRIHSVWTSKKVPKVSGSSRGEAAQRDRFSQVKDLRLFNVSVNIYLTSDNEQTLKAEVRAVKAAIQAEFSSESSKVTTREVRGLYLLKALGASRVFTPSSPSTIMTASDAARFIRLPVSDIPGVERRVTARLAVPSAPQRADGNLELGDVMRGEKPINKALLPIVKLAGHMIVVGASQSGKSNFVKNLVIQLLDKDICVLVFDAHNEYVELLPLLRRDVWVIDPTTMGFSINVLELPGDVDPSDSTQVSPYVENVLLTVKSLFPGSSGPILEGLARESLYNLYLKRGSRAPTFKDWLEEARGIAENRDERYRNAFDSLNARLMKFMQGWYGQFFNQPHTTLPIEEVLEKPVFIQLRGLDAEGQSFLVASFLKTILGYRKRHGASPRLHVSILEEAHLYAPRIFKASSSLEEMRLVPASLFLAEAAKFNHGLILVDQSPSRIAEDAIVNSNALVVFKLFYQPDKRVILTALGYDPNSPQGIRLGEYLTSLGQGHAIVRTATSPYPFEIKTPLIQTPKKPDTGEKAEAILVQEKRSLTPTGDGAPLPPRTDKAWRIIGGISSTAAAALLSIKDRDAFKKSEIRGNSAFLELESKGLISKISSSSYRLTNLGKNVILILSSLDSAQPTVKGRGE